MARGNSPGHGAVCPRCRSHLVRDSRFCNHCGNRLDLQYTEALGSTAPASGRVHASGDVRPHAPAAMVRVPRVSRMETVPPAPRRVRRRPTLPTPARVLGPLLAAALCFGAGVSAAGLYRRLTAPPAKAAVERARAETAADFGGVTWVFRDGVAIVTADPESDFAKSGLRAGDVIVRVDGEPLESLDELGAHVASAPEGRPVSLEYVRDGRHDVVTLARPEAAESAGTRRGD